MFLFLSHFFKSLNYYLCHRKRAQGQGYKMAALVSFKAGGPPRFEADSLWRRASSEHPPAAVSFPPPRKTAIPKSVLERGHSLARSQGRRRIQVPQHVASIPIKACLITQRSGSCRVFLMWLSLGLTISA